MTKKLQEFICDAEQKLMSANQMDQILGGDVTIPVIVHFLYSCDTMDIGCPRNPGCSYNTDACGGPISPTLKMTCRRDGYEK